MFVINQVLPYWKHNDEQPILEMLDELPEELNHVYVFIHCTVIKYIHIFGCNVPLV